MKVLPCWNMEFAVTQICVLWSWSLKCEFRISYLLFTTFTPLRWEIFLLLLLLLLKLLNRETYWPCWLREKQWALKGDGKMSVTQSQWLLKMGDTVLLFQQLETSERQRVPLSWIFFFICCDLYILITIEEVCQL